MGSSINGEDATDIIDPACVPDVFCEGIAHVAKIGGNCIRFSIFATRDLGGGQTERVIVARMVWSIEALRVANLQNRMVIEGGVFLSAGAPSIMTS